MVKSGLFSKLAIPFEVEDLGKNNFKYKSTSILSRMLFSDWLHYYTTHYLFGDR